MGVLWTDCHGGEEGGAPNTVPSLRTGCVVRNDVTALKSRGADTVRGKRLHVIEGGGDTVPRSKRSGGKYVKGGGKQSIEKPAQFVGGVPGGESKVGVLKPKKGGIHGNP